MTLKENIFVRAYLRKYEITSLELLNVFEKDYEKSFFDFDLKTVKHHFSFCLNLFENYKEAFFFKFVEEL